MDCADTMEIASSVAKVREYTDNQLRNVQIACTTFATLCTRAAIEGGLSTTKSYCLGDAYIKSFFLAKTASEVSAIKNQMYKDFVTRVHNCRNNPQYSKWCREAGTTSNYIWRNQSALKRWQPGLAIQSIICPHGLKRKSGALSTTTSNLYALNGRNACFPQRKKYFRNCGEYRLCLTQFFASTFKQCVGKTPAQYRKEMLNT